MLTLARMQFSFHDQYSIPLPQHYILAYRGTQQLYCWQRHMFVFLKRVLKIRCWQKDDKCAAHGRTERFGVDFKVSSFKVDISL